MHACIHANKKSVWVWLTGIFRENHKLPLELYRQSPCFDNRNGRYGYLDGIVVMGTVDNYIHPNITIFPTTYAI